jgi:hypothetical protein
MFSGLEPAFTLDSPVLLALRAAGFDGGSVPVGIDEDGRERLEFIEGAWRCRHTRSGRSPIRALASVTILMRRFHDASGSVGWPEASWSSELADPVGGGLIVCHNDVCLENVVFRDGVAVGLLDFDFAAPGRPVYDLAQFARMCVPVDDEISAARLGRQSADRARRLRLVADVYGLTAVSRSLRRAE